MSLYALPLLCGWDSVREPVPLAGLIQPGGGTLIRDIQSALSSKTPTGDEKQVLEWYELTHSLFRGYDARPHLRLRS